MPNANRDSSLTDESMALVARFRAGDERAAAAIYDRYAERLLALARRRLSRKVAARVDPDDVVQSAYRSFFLRAKGGQYTLGRSGELWRLLAGIALHKLLKQVRRHTAGRRSVKREAAAGALPPGALELACREPTPEQAASLADELALVFADLQPVERTIFELRLQGCELREIAAQTGKSDRTARRVLAEIKRRLIQRQNELNEREPPRPAGRQPAPRPRKSAATAAGTLLHFEDYLLQRLIGAGGMGKAYAAIDKRDQRPVCVKVLHKSRLTDPRAVARFVDEARIVARLRHPNIVAVHGLGRLPDGGYFMVFDLIDGEDLLQTIRRRQLSIAEARGIALCAAEAIEHAHNQGVVHCDLKPSNVLIDGQGRVVIADFGLARVMENGISGIADVAYIAGTAAFMAPEQADRRFGPVDERTDVYGLGGLLFALLTGSPPLPAATAAEALRKLTSPAIQPPPPIELRPDTPEELSEFCLRCLSKRPDLRYASIGEAARALSLRRPCRK